MWISSMVHCFRRIQGFRDLWVLAVAPGRAPSDKPVDANAKAA